eukprot:TRINITY_DN375_c0_g3_i2.p1 TRINITY_DN375_c0_g3~~TRINITY_DN375_c0_g3_i2.p1  ORF type:complete len:379 (-),score=68.54 TRINITY_DN375_c0_g3_i2:18-1154(-)
MRRPVSASPTLTPRRSKLSPSVPAWLQKKDILERDLQYSRDARATMLKKVVAANLRTLAVRTKLQQETTKVISAEKERQKQEDRIHDLEAQVEEAHAALPQKDATIQRLRNQLEESTSTATQRGADLQAVSTQLAAEKADLEDRLATEARALAAAQRDKARLDELLAAARQKIDELTESVMHNSVERELAVAKVSELSDELSSERRQHADAMAKVETEREAVRRRMSEAVFLRPVDTKANVSRRAPETSPSVGILKIHLIGGVKLKAADLNGTSDPYIIFQCGKVEIKSDHVEKSLSPFWNQIMSLPVYNRDDILRMTLMDYNERLSHTQLGIGGCDIRDLLPSTSTPKELEFFDKITSVSVGTIFFTLTYVPLVLDM